MPNPIKTYLSLMVLGSNRSSAIKQLMRYLHACGGHILTTKMASMGSEFGIIFMIEGHWNAIVKIETGLPGLEKKLGVTTMIKRTNLKNSRKKYIPYSMNTVTADREGLVNDLIQFFLEYGINIENINTQTYNSHTGIRMAAISIQLNVDSTVHIPGLRDKFVEYCDNINLDASLDLFRDYV